MKKNLGNIIMSVGFIITLYGAISIFPTVFYYMGQNLDFFTNLKQGIYFAKKYLKNDVIIFFFGIFVFIIGILFKKK